MLINGYSPDNRRKQFETDIGHMYLNRFSKLNSITILIIATPFFMILSRNITSPILVVVTILLVCLVFREEGLRTLAACWKVTLTSFPALTLAALLTYMALTCSWSTAHERCLESTGHLAGNLMLFSLCVSAFCFNNDRFKIRSIVPVFALLATPTLMVSELHFGSPVREILGGSTESFRMNRAAVAIVLFLPFLLVFLQTKLGSCLGLVITLAVGASVFYSESESAKLSFVISVVTLPVFILMRQKGIWLLCAFVLASLMFMPLVAPYIMTVMPEIIMETVPYGTAGLRADIWAAHANLLSNAPVFGHGVEASFMAREDYKHTDIPQMFLGWGHPHNFAIQVWYELGVVGVILFSLLIIAYFRALRHVPVRFLPFVLTTTAAVWTVFMVSHGAWQAWWWSLIGIIAIMWMLLLRNDQEEEKVAD